MMTLAAEIMEARIVSLTFQHPYEKGALEDEKRRRTVLEVRVSDRRGVDEMSGPRLLLLNNAV